MNPKCEQCGKDVMTFTEFFHAFYAGYKTVDCRNCGKTKEITGD